MPLPGGGRRDKIIGKNIVKLREEDGSDRLLIAGQPDYTRCDNTLITSRYTYLNFLPITIRNQFRRLANMYFLIVGIIMWVGTRFPWLFSSAFHPVTTLGPIAFFISISLMSEAIADKKRHVSDYKTNNFRCIVVENSTANTTPVSDSMASSMNEKMGHARRKKLNSSIVADENSQNQISREDVDVFVDGHNTVASLNSIRKKDIRQGHLVVVRNREMIPADMVMLASSGDRGCAYIETSSIDGETNLKLRLSAKHKSDPSFNQTKESIEEAVRRLASFTIVGFPDDKTGSDHVAQLVTEAPNAHINTFTGLLKLPSLTTIDEEEPNAASRRELPLGADNLLIRGAVLRNTEWAIGLACFTGTDTKLSQNTVEAPAKFSQLDLLTNKCVIIIMILELVCIAYLATFAVTLNKRRIEEQWYLGRSMNDFPWPYLSDLPPPEWSSRGQNWIQYSLTNITLLSYFVPLSMYFTLECCNFFLIWLISTDPDMYDATTDTRAETRSTIYTDLGQIQYIFSDKTGTLTQNVMRFKRCSVDGMVFGRPISNTNPSGKSGNKSRFLPLRQVLTGQVNIAEDGTRLKAEKGMTFNAELFLRVMSLCHTVVVEKDLDLPKDEKGKNKSDVDVESPPADSAPDGAPSGYAYQAESPDEGALVSASSQTFGIQVVSTDSSGIRIRCNHPTFFGDEKLVRSLKSGKADLNTIATESMSGLRGFDYSTHNKMETWSVLAINKFDSTRKRMSILLRSPPEFGSCAVLFCKGADSAMLDPEVSASSETLYRQSDEQDEKVLKQDQPEDSEWGMAKMLGLEAHLGEFASEGLRTLVLGVRFLTDEECKEWLEMYTAAATAINGRDEKLTAAAFQIEQKLHIVGATAIEDKLQTGVPDAISTLDKAGIKLWVLTGDKRETAIEIGYSTKVLTPRMHLTEVVDHGEEFVRAQCAMEFMRLVKAGKLPLYQRAVVDQQEGTNPFFSRIFSSIGNLFKCMFMYLKEVILTINITTRAKLGMKKRAEEKQLQKMKKEAKAEKGGKSDLQRRLSVRNRAEAIVKKYMERHPTNENNRDNLSSDVLPPVFNRASSAQEILDIRRKQGKLTAADKRASRLSQLNAQELAENRDSPTIDDDMLSVRSFMPSEADKSKSNFDRKKRSMLERMFAVDRDVRKGRLVKHLKKEKRIEALSPVSVPQTIIPSSDGPRALVIEGAALKHLQGDVELEELVFNVASQCDSVIACRVTPRQKAQLVNLVRHHVEPEPVTLAIGDGANDVGMIHAAHVGIGISGKEGQQAVNASDFSIGQFRFLEDLILYHGRWDFLRTTMVVLYTFYKNVVMAFLLVLYNNETMFSGTSIFDQWIMSGYSFFCFWPIMSIGMFDRNLQKSYIKKNPEVYKPTRQNEIITPRTLCRWSFITIAHTLILYYGQLYQLSGGGARASTYSNLLSQGRTVGDGEVADWQSLGTTLYTSLVLLMGYKMMYEARSIICGKNPAIITCFKNTKEGFLSRVPYTWVCVVYFSFGVYFLFLLIYNVSLQNSLVHPRRTIVKILP